MLFLMREASSIVTASPCFSYIPSLWAGSAGRKHPSRIPQAESVALNIAKRLASYCPVTSSFVYVLARSMCAFLTGSRDVASTFLTASGPPASILPLSENMSIE